MFLFIFSKNLQHKVLKNTNRAIQMVAQKNPNKYEKKQFYQTKVKRLYTVVIGCIISPHFLKESNLTMILATECYDDILQKFLIPE